MKKYLLVFVLLLSVGCSENSESVEKLRDSLGDYQYMGLDPQLSFKLQDIDFMEAKTYYKIDSPSVKYTLDIKRYNNKFPVDSFEIGVKIVVLDRDNVELYSFNEFTKMEEKVASVSGIKNLYGIDLTNLSGLKLKVKSYWWNPIRKFKPYKPRLK